MELSKLERAAKIYDLLKQIDEFSGKIEQMKRTQVPSSLASFIDHVIIMLDMGGEFLDGFSVILKNKRIALLEEIRKM